MLQGYGVLIGSCFRSTPQIARIVRAGSARGVSLTASIAELIAYSITCAYNMRLGASRWHRVPSSDCSRQLAWMARLRTFTAELVVTHRHGFWAGTVVHAAS